MVLLVTTVTFTSPSATCQQRTSTCSSIRPRRWPTWSEATISLTIWMIAMLMPSAIREPAYLVRMSLKSSMMPMMRCTFATISLLSSNSFQSSRTMQLRRLLLASIATRTHLVTPWVSGCATMVKARLAPVSSRLKIALLSKWSLQRHSESKSMREIPLRVKWVTQFTFLWTSGSIFRWRYRQVALLKASLSWPLIRMARDCSSSTMVRA